jgi:ABC-2 type transport system ATP-binding protein
LIYDLSSQGVTVLVTTHYMDEAEYCHRVGMMRGGKLLAMDTPLALKNRYVQGGVYEISVDSLTAGLKALEASPLIERASLAGDHLRVITTAHADAAASAAVTQDDLRAVLAQAGVAALAIAPGEPALEDVFVHLAHANG